MIVIDNRKPGKKKRPVRPISLEYVENGIRKIKGVVNPIRNKNGIMKGDEVVVQWSDINKAWVIPKS